MTVSIIKRRRHLAYPFNEHALEVTVVPSTNASSVIDLAGEEMDQHQHDLQFLLWDANKNRVGDLPPQVQNCQKL